MNLVNVYQSELKTCVEYYRELLSETDECIIYSVVVRHCEHGFIEFKDTVSKENLSSVNNLDDHITCTLVSPSNTEVRRYLPRAINCNRFPVSIELKLLLHDGDEFCVYTHYQSNIITFTYLPVAGVIGKSQFISVDIPSENLKSVLTSQLNYDDGILLEGVNNICEFAKVSDIEYCVQLVDGSNILNTYVSLIDYVTILHTLYGIVNTKVDYRSINLYGNFHIIGVGLQE